jgi:membrane-associated phospholipid phosphatase
VALIVGAWLLYSVARSSSGDDIAAAVRRGQIVQNWDQVLGFGFTFNLNHWVTAHALLAVPMTLDYASLHYLVTPLVLVWLWRSHPAHYRPALLALLSMSAIGLVVYMVLPVAPPRLLPGSGWIDTMSTWSRIGWWGSGGSAPEGLEHLTDQFAAMPSLHVGWAVWCAWVWRRTGGITVQRFGWIYPATTAATVIATANHYVLDVVVGTLLALATCLVVPRLLERRAAGRSISVRDVGAVLNHELQLLGRSMGFPSVELLDADRMEAGRMDAELRESRLIDLRLLEQQESAVASRSD